MLGLLGHRHSNLSIWERHSFELEVAASTRNSATLEAIIIGAVMVVSDNRFVGFAE